MARRKREWLTAVSAYTIGGAVTSTGVALAAGVVGSVLFGNVRTAAGIAALLLLLLAAASDLGVVRLPLPQPRRQTRGWWSKQFSLPVAAGMWGLEVGLAVVTWLTYAGTAAFLAASVLVADVEIALLMMGGFWVGRVLPVWLAPLLVAGVREVDELATAVQRGRTVFGRMHRLGVLASVVAVAVHTGTLSGLQV